MKAILDILKKLNYITTPKQKRKLVFVYIVAFIGSMWELLGVASIIPFLTTVMTPEKAEEQWYSALVTEMFGATDPVQRMTILGLIMIVIYIVKNIYLMFSTYVQASFSTGVQKDLSVRLTRTYLGSSYLFHLDHNSSILIRSVNQDVAGVFGMFFYLFRIVSELFTLAAIGLLIILLDPIMAVSLILILGSCMLLLIFGLKKLMKFFSRQEQNCEGRMLQYLTQAFNGIKEILVKNRQKYFVDAFEEASATNARATKINYFLNSITTNIYEMVCICGFLAIVIIRLRVVDDIGEFVTRLGTVALAAFRLFPSMGRLTTNTNGMIYNRVRLDYVYENLKEIENDEEYVTRLKEDKEERLGFEKELEIKDIVWKYPTGQEEVLKGAGFVINKGESIALIGPSGAGKTTMADVILGLLKPQKGNVLLDGVDVYEHPAAWSKVIGYVPQAVYLTDDTIRNNVAFGIDEKEIDEERIWRALEEAQLADYIRKQPEGLETMVGERGVRLSGGQRQRIAIARALYDNPQILVLDEATSALDNETETAVMEAIESLQGSKTMIIVAHRLSTIRNCDKIYEINGGKATLRDKEEVLKES